MVIGFLRGTPMQEAGRGPSSKAAGSVCGLGWEAD